MSDLARTPKQIGNLVRRTRKKRGLSQTQLGDKAGLRQETICLGVRARSLVFPSFQDVNPLKKPASYGAAVALTG